MAEVESVAETADEKSAEMAGIDTDVPVETCEAVTTWRASVRFGVLESGSREKMLMRLEKV